MSGEVRSSMKAQIGYLTAKVEDLDEFIKDHMDREELKFSSIHKWMIGLTGAMVLQSAGLTLEQLFSLLVEIVL